MFRKSRRVRGGVVDDRQEEPQTFLPWKQQEAYLELLLRGASPLGACQELGLDYFQVMRFATEDTAFGLRIQQVGVALSQNVATRLYQEAMKGNVSAMSHWLKYRRPPEWEVGEDDSELETAWDVARESCGSIRSLRVN